MLMRTDEAGNHGTRGTENGGWFGSCGCLVTTNMQMIILTMTMTSIMVLWLEMSMDIMTERGTQRMVNIMMECEATRELRGVGDITWSRFRHCLRYSLLVQVTRPSLSWPWLIRSCS